MVKVLTGGTGCASRPHLFPRGPPHRCRQPRHRPRRPRNRVRAFHTWM